MSYRDFEQELVSIIRAYGAVRSIRAVDLLMQDDGGCLDYAMDTIVDQDLPVPLSTYRNLEQLVIEGFDDYRPDWGTTMREELRPLVKELADKWPGVRPARIGGSLHVRARRAHAICVEGVPGFRKSFNNGESVAPDTVMSWYSWIEAEKPRSLEITGRQLDWFVSQGRIRFFISPEDSLRPDPPHRAACRAGSRTP